MAFLSAHEFLKTLKDKPHHAWLLKGSDQTQKKNFIAEVTLALLPDIIFPDTSGQGWQHIMHPGFLYISPEEKPSISVDQVRKIQHYAHKTSATGDWKICIIDALNHLTIQGQNAILKILEAPPPKNLFFILHHPGHPLLPTIASRTAMLNFSRPQETLDQKALITMDGLGEAESDTNAKELLSDIHGLVQDMLTHKDKTHAMLAMNKKHIRFTPVFLDLLQLWGKTSVRYAALHETESMSPLSMLPLEKLLEFDQYMGRLNHEYTQLGLDDKQAIFSACQKLRRLASA